MSHLPNKAQREFNEKILEKLEGKDVHISDSKIAKGVRDALVEKFASKGVEAPRLETQADLNNAVELLKALPDRQAPSGSAPLNSQQCGEKTDLYTRKFENPKQMIEVLGKLARQGNAEAQAYLDKITSNWIGAKKRNRTQPDPIFDPNAPENQPLMKKVGHILTPVAQQKANWAKSSKIGGNKTQGLDELENN